MTHVWTRDNTSFHLVLISVAFSISLLTFAFILCWATIDSRDHSKRSRDTLKFVLVVSRHGNRGTVTTIPNDPYPASNPQFWPYGQGGLTPHGRVQMYNLGMKIRSLYDGFLDPLYNTNEFYASSTAIDRTLLSGEAFLFGLYPRTAHDPRDKKFFKQLIPLYSNSPDKTLEAEYCEKVLSIRNTTETLFHEENAAVIEGLNEYLSKYSGRNTTGAVGFYPTWDAIFCASTEGYALPDWMQQIYPHPLDDLAAKYLIISVAGTDQLVRLIIGNFYQEIVGIMTSKVRGTLSPDRKMYYYSGHDFTLVTLQAILGIPASSIRAVATPGSAMIFEIHKEPNDEDFSIQVLYIDGTSKDLTPKNLPIPNCNPTCNFHQLMNNTRWYTSISGNFQQECQL